MTTKFPYRTIISKTWHRAGHKGLAIAEIECIGQKWTVVKWDGKDDPECHKSAGLLRDYAAKPPTKKEFRTILNLQDAQARTMFPNKDMRFVQKRFHQVTRWYGDYIWHQDREKFEYEYTEYLTDNGYMNPPTPETMK